MPIVLKTRREIEMMRKAGQVACRILGMMRAADRWEVRLRGPRGEETVRARLVIAADGVESMVGRWAGLDTRVPARDMESCAQYVVSGIAIPLVLPTRILKPLARERILELHRGDGNAVQAHGDIERLLGAR